MTVRILTGDCREVLATLPDASVHCVVTSPPYYGLRDYQAAQWDGGDPGCDHLRPAAHGYDPFATSTLGPKRDGCAPDNSAHSDAVKRQQFRDTCGKCGARRIDRQIGLEPTPAEYVAQMVAVFREVRRVLRPDGTVWLNLGDSYASNPGSGYAAGKFGTLGATAAAKSYLQAGAGTFKAPTRLGSDIKPKDLLMIPARVALALQADGWWLRSDIIWHKTAPMPESVTDRPTSSHEHVFLLAKSARYFFDAEAVREADAGQDHARNVVEPVNRSGGHLTDDRGIRTAEGRNGMGRNIRNVWTIATAPFAEAHFATFPPELAERCIKAGTKPGDTVLDPFGGAGTTGLVADRLGRNAILIELNPDYAAMSERRLTNDAGLFAEVVTQ